MKTIALLCLLASSSLAVEQDSSVVPSSNKELSIRYVWIDDDTDGGDAYTHTAILQRGSELPWSFSARGRAMLFSWSPDARYLLIGVVKPGRDMSLYYIDTRAKNPKERNLNLEAIEERVEAALPERDPQRESASYASHHQIDFDRVEWTSPTRCRLHYTSQFFRKAGDAVLSLALDAGAPKIKIEKITPRGAD